MFGCSSGSGFSSRLVALLLKAARLLYEESLLPMSAGTDGGGTDENPNTL